MVDLTSVILAERSSACETGVGNLPATTSQFEDFRWRGSREKHTLGQTGTEQTGNLLDEGVGGDEGIVLARELLDELLVLVELLEIIGAHGVDTAVLGTINVVLVTEDADGHAGAGDRGELDGARETLVTLGVIVLEADLEPGGWFRVSIVGRKVAGSWSSYSTVSRKLRFLVSLLYSRRSATC